VLSWLGISLKLVGAVLLGAVALLYGPDKLDCPDQVGVQHLSVHWPWCESSKVSHLPSDEGVPHESKEVPKGQKAKAL
jgi:hypothetical protein